ncbi:metallophosphoesterase family protein [Blautia sp. MSJ-9]|uniref:metallophosphoesterase family protein n=1 Tax=Blautia sp. MSJ-9 TaxID=2841511 RepID=UPI001C116AC4|nr:metallophosphoesterase [Blautia sp. MSJ-9]MBU5682048.1 metallophosphoesterase [Blautia sp. MSJ-9]
MKVLIVSDTHGRDENLEEAVLREAPFDYLIHCGDVEGREIFIESLAECPCIIVAGNNDFFTDLSHEEEITLEGHKMLVTHGHYYFVSRNHDRLVEKAREDNCQIAMYGHTHMPVIEEEDGILVINPGSLTYPRQRGRMPSYAVMELEQGKAPQVEIRYL